MAQNPPFANALARFVLEHAAVRGALVSLDGACREILDCHPYPPALRHVLAELLAAAALLASTLKFKGALIVQLQGDGPVRLLVVECDATLALRATAQWKDAAAALPAGASLAELAGGPEHGRLVITLDPKDGGPLYQGVVALEAASVATLIEHYLRTSEQIDSRMAIATDGRRVRGLLLQRLPGATAADDETWERAAAQVEGLAPEALLAPRAAPELLQAHFPDDDVRLFRARPASLLVQLLRGARRQRAAPDRTRRGREHPGRAGPGRRDVRVLQPPLHVRRGGRARALRDRSRRRSPLSSRMPR